MIKLSDFLEILNSKQSIAVYYLENFEDLENGVGFQLIADGKENIKEEYLNCVISEVSATDSKLLVYIF